MNRRGHGRLVAPLVALLLGGGAIAGCYHPTIEEGGFACDPTQVPACPEGYVCIGGRCHTPDGGGTQGGIADLSGGGSALDLAGGGGTGGGGGGGSGGGGGGGSGGSGGGGGGGSCAHNLCTTGAKLSSSCDPCVTQICAQDSYCCQTKWSSQCVGEVASICHQSCP